MKMNTAGAAALLVVLAGTAWADNPQVETGNDVQPIVTHEDVPVVDAFVGKARVADRKFWLVGAALNAAMLLDTKSTFDVRRRCARCVESNPYAAPFVNRGPVVAFTAGQVFDVGIMMLAVKMKASRKPQIQKIWWLVPVALTSGHLIAYQHNRGVAR